MSLLLAIETSTRCCSVALGDGSLLLERIADRPREHHALVLPMVAELLADAGLGRTHIDAIAFGRGPGSFTGLRIAAGFSQGLGFALQRPVIPVSSLAALALAVHEVAGANSDVFTAMDAHMGELFIARFRTLASGVVADGPETLVSVQSFPRVQVGAALLAGDAWRIYPEIVPAGAAPPLAECPLARHVLALGLCAGPESQCEARDAEPFYLRGVNAWKTREQHRR